MRTFDLVLMDTAGRSPRDEVRIQELRSMLAEAGPDEVHLVLSAASSARSLAAAAEKFAPVGVTSLLITKLDEATGLGNLLSLTRLPPALQLPHRRPKRPRRHRDRRRRSAWRSSSSTSTPRKE